jgi:hypothetical protein
MKASKFSDARKAYILKQGADGTLVVIPHGAIGSDCCPPSVQGQAERPDLAGQTWRRTQPGTRRLAATMQPRLARLTGADQFAHLIPRKLKARYAHCQRSDLPIWISGTCSPLIGLDRMRSIGS